MTVDCAKLHTGCDCRLCKVKLDVTVDCAKLNTGCDCRLYKVKHWM